MSTERPSWHARREIAPFVLDDAEVQAVIDAGMHAVVSWVTKKNEPVQAVMVYVVLDDLITVTSTTNRAKYHAWSRNPAASFCIWDPADIGRQITVRGQMEILQDADLMRRWTEGFLRKAMKGRDPSPEQIDAEYAKFDAPDRHVMQLHVEKVLSHDLRALLVAEREGLDVWG